MADERDPKLQSAYRALGAEQPPPALDEAILAAARGTARPWTRRWAVPLSLAAVLVLSVTVTLRIQHEQPDSEVPAPAKREIVQAREPVKPEAERAALEPAGKPALRRESRAFPPASQDRAVAQRPAQAPAPPPAEAPALAKRQDAEASSAAAAPAMRAMQRERVAAERTVASQASPSPERELERIAELRKQGKHDEADKALAEFRKRYPDFKIPDTLLERVERR